MLKLTYLHQVDFYHNYLDQSLSNSRVSGQFLLLLRFIDIPVFNPNCVDPDQTLLSAASDLGLHCMPPVGGVRLKWSTG